MKKLRWCILPRLFLYPLALLCGLILTAKLPFFQENEDQWTGVAFAAVKTQLFLTTRWAGLVPEP